jgi:hypothetical protein
MMLDQCVCEANAGTLTSGANYSGVETLRDSVRNGFPHVVLLVCRCEPEAG